MIVSKSPGKLYIAGEYAVVEKGYPAIIIAVDQFIEVSLKPSKDKGSIHAYDNIPISFIRQKDRLVLDYRDDRLSYVVNCIKVVEQLAVQLNMDLNYFDLSIKSSLEDEQGKKYGLGSSAAVTVSTIKVLSKFYKIDLTKEQLFKLAAIVHLNINSNGSGGDLAASIYGGWIVYKSFDKNWLSKKLKVLSVKELLQVKWPYLEIKSLKAPKDLTLVIGWTETPASTTVLVDKINQGKKEQKIYYLDFLQKSKDCVEKMVLAFEDNDTLKIQNQININKQLLKDLGDKFKVEIETAQLSKLIEIANNFKGSAKSSGAGGGDCGIAIFKDDVDQIELINQWQNNGIVYLPLKVYQEECENE
ncbi:MAG: phosphomevalonate kinase [Erysipelothrix sp.]|nr:phosphomevalonate kinase [Erysipelothrix sp.]